MPLALLAQCLMFVITACDLLQGFLESLARRNQSERGMSLCAYVAESLAVCATLLRFTVSG